MGYTIFFHQQRATTPREWEAEVKPLVSRVIEIYDRDVGKWIDPKILREGYDSAAPLAGGDGTGRPMTLLLEDQYALVSLNGRGAGSHETFYLKLRFREPLPERESGGNWFTKTNRKIYGASILAILHLLRKRGLVRFGTDDGEWAPGQYMGDDYWVEFYDFATEIVAEVERDVSTETDRKIETT